MAKRNSQNVRLKEEVVEPLNQYIRPRGKSQQHVVSVGAWFYMCMPESLTPLIGDAFYEWCKEESATTAASLPRNCPDLLRRIINLIHIECSREVSKDALHRQENPNADIGNDPNSEDAKRALDVAVSKLDKKKPAS